MPPDPSSPFSDANLAKAVAPVAEQATNKIKAGVVYDQANGLTGEIEGRKDWRNGIFISGDLTYSQRAKLGAKLLLGWTGK